MIAALTDCATIATAHYNCARKMLHSAHYRDNCCHWLTLQCTLLLLLLLLLHCYR
jgi:hypothetical protein